MAVIYYALITIIYHVIQNIDLNVFNRIILSDREKILKNIFYGGYYECRNERKPDYYRRGGG